MTNLLVPRNRLVLVFVAMLYHQVLHSISVWFQQFHWCKKHCCSHHRTFYHQHIFAPFSRYHLKWINQIRFEFEFLSISFELFWSENTVHVPANAVATHKATNNKATHLFIVLVLFQVKILLQRLSKINWMKRAVLLSLYILNHLWMLRLNIQCQDRFQINSDFLSCVLNIICK